MAANLRNVDLPTMIGQLVQLQRLGKVYKGCCPFHQEKTASFSVRWAKDRWRFHCFGCGAGGDAVDWLCLTRNIDFKEAIRLLEIGDAKPTKQQLQEKQLRERLEVERARRQRIFFDRNPECPIPEWAIDWDAPRVPRGAYEAPPEVRETDDEEKRAA